MLTEIIDKVKNYEKIVSETMNLKDECEKLLHSSSLPYDTKKFIDDLLYGNLSDEEKNQIKQFEDIQKHNAEQDMLEDRNSTSYVYVSDSGFFNPYKDEYIIIDYGILGVENDKIEIMVEVPKRRMYMGISGSWIPKYYRTQQFHISELKQLEHID